MKRKYPLGCVVRVNGRRGTVRTHAERFDRPGDPVYRVELDAVPDSPPTFVYVRESEISAREGAAV